MSTKKKSFTGKFILLLFIVLLGIGGYWGYKTYFKSNVHLHGKNYVIIFVSTGSNYQDLLDILYGEDIINDHASFEFIANSMGLKDKVQPGRYRINLNMNNRQIVNMIMRGKQEKVKLSLNSQIRNKEDFINYIAGKLELDKGELSDYMDNTSLLNEKYGLNSENVMALVIPGTYELNWTTHLEELFQVLNTEYDSLWTADRRKRAKRMGYTPAQITTLASIVQSESSIRSEQEKIAGVYLNRLKKDMRLQADPTLVFANGLSDVQRLRNADKDIDSPYNTYRYNGLPPGPICLVYPQAIDAVLNYTAHKFIYFCAKPDFSGYSDFTDDYDVHQRNAKRYQNELSRRGINR